MGSNKYLLTHLVDCDREVGVNIFYPDGEEETTTTWEEKVSIAHLDFSEFEPRYVFLFSFVWVILIFRRFWLTDCD